jgi:hypothetical protein
MVLLVVKEKIRIWQVGEHNHLSKYISIFC